MVEGLQSHLDPLNDKLLLQLLKSLDKGLPSWDRAFPKKDSSYFQPLRRTRSPGMNVLAFIPFSYPYLSFC